MIKRSLKKARNFLTTIRHFQNWKEILKDKHPNTVIFRNGLEIYSPETETLMELVSEIFIRKVYAPKLVAIEPRDVVVDIGANIGLFTMFAAQRTQNQVYAFEPFPGNTKILNQNLLANQLKNVVLHEKVVSDKSGTAKLFISQASTGHLIFNKNIRGPLEKFIQVPSTTLTDFMEEAKLSEIDFLKLDCEGAEGHILSSTSNDVLARIRKIALEFHDNVSILQHDDIRRLLRTAGFEIQMVWDGESPFGYIYAKRKDVKKKAHSRKKARAR